MECLALAEVTLSANPATPSITTRALRVAMPAARRPSFVFVTFAVEIEGEAPLFFCTEAVDE